MATNKNDLVNNALGKIKSSPGFGGRIGMDPDSMVTMDYIDSDGDGVDDRNQRGPGQPYITFEKATQEEKNKFKQGKGSGQGQTSNRTNFAKQYLDTFSGTTNTNQQTGSSDKDKIASDFGKYKAATFGGALFNQGWGGMVDWGNKYDDNEAIQGYVSGAKLDFDTQMMDAGLDLLYQKGQLSQMADYQGGMENLKTGNTLKLLAAEGGITRDLMWDQGDIKSRQIGEQGVEDRAQIKTLGSENRKTRRVEGSETRMTEMTKGDQTRKTQRDKYREDRKMRADARGAIRRTGSRFFG